MVARFAFDAAVPVVFLFFEDGEKFLPVDFACPDDYFVAPRPALLGENSASSDSWGRKSLQKLQLPGRVELKRTRLR